MTTPERPQAILASARVETIRTYEDAATAVGRLDAAAGGAPAGIQRLVIARCAVRPMPDSQDGMIALLRPDGEGDPRLGAYHRALEAGAARARGGVVPSVATLLELLGEPPDALGPDDSADALLHDATERAPPVLKAVCACGAILRMASRGGRDADAGIREEAARVAALAVSLVLCVGGAITDAWLTLPIAGDEVLTGGPGEGEAGWDPWLGAAFGALAREARAAERGIAAARALAESDETRVRETLGRAAYSALDVLAMLRSDIVLTVPDAARALSLTPPTAGAAVARLEEMEIAREVTGRARSRAFVYSGLVEALAPAPQ